MQEQVKQIREKISNSFKFTKEEMSIIDEILSHDINYPRIKVISELIISNKLDKASMLAFLTYQLYKVEPEKADELLLKMNNEVCEMVNDFKTIKDINKLTQSEEIEDVEKEMKKYIVLYNSKDQ